MLYYRLTNIEIQIYYQIELPFDSFYSESNLLPIKGRTQEIFLDEYDNIVTHSVTCYVKNDDATYLNIVVLDTFQNRLKNTLVIKV